MGIVKIAVTMLLRKYLAHPFVSNNIKDSGKFCQFGRSRGCQNCEVQFKNKNFKEEG